MSLLKIENLHACIDGKEILKGIDLEMGPGEIHAIMGPNGSGKSTLSYVLAGRDGYEVTEGSVTFKGKNLLELEADERANEGIFLAFQYPVEIPGVAGMTFLRESYNAKLRHHGEPEADAMQFLKMVRAKAKTLNMNDDMLKRPVNVGFSGGEKKRNEILQMAVLEPRLAILDETDSGLDIDALKIVASGVNKLAEEDPEMSVLLITHYQRLLDYIKPDYVHVMVDGRIVKSGGPEVALELEADGYSEYEAAEAAASS
jgi:Fe-S cluster assembly ATP-binding protein